MGRNASAASLFRLCRFYCQTAHETLKCWLVCVGNHKVSSTTELREVEDAMSKPEVAISRIETAIPPVPLSPEATQLDYGFLADLTLKTVYADAN